LAVFTALSLSTSVVEAKIMDMDTTRKSIKKDHEERYEDHDRNYDTISAIETMSYDLEDAYSHSKTPPIAPPNYRNLDERVRYIVS